MKSKADDMALFVQVVRSDGLAAAGRVLGLSPASMTARINALEAHYKTRLLTRNTRSIKLTEAGERFYQGCVRVIEEVAAAEALLQDADPDLRGTLKIAASSDFGRQYVVPAVAEFATQHPQVVVNLSLGEGLVKLVESGTDIAIRYGNLNDSSLISRPLLNNRRMLVAAPNYLEQYGTPDCYQALQRHRCLVLERAGQALNDWYFIDRDTQATIIETVPTCLVSSDGEVLRNWAIQGLGITIKSWLDVHKDIKAGRLVELLPTQTLGFSPTDSDKVALQAIYPSRQFQPRQVKAFLTFFSEYLQQMHD
ncbi:LysR family transcriptional regulator [Pseudoalteromonas sp. A22]|uniref:LysR family transcriptional regulator n=1 Tax=Pseudoalteromonas maricaloris TaxID=184924 RepID=A0A8I2GZX6_9GAMM|nr:MULTISPECIES: LysR family transcriptional regulator [Pseudoalteromonas]NLR20773.1 LysR family transcriptional regulator [Pseudoalteromonas maricaloris]QUI62883.1 LysR family transcriptional regulator [Pseudoalteromonas sp. A22]RZG14903.1 LysR family transcriptional regulator [Pseudoalteromonas sp. CO342X]USE68542.1 LysR family transcriptional regulator [Pseudoalteromonas flavipulchra]WOX29744.1 LysR family transcriptional regulator [Pseudoalteromonas maricaloris]